MPINQLKKTVKEIAEMFFELADDYYTSPTEVEDMRGNEPNYFDVIGSKGVSLQKKVKNELPEDIVVLTKETKLRIEAEAGPGYTMEGKRTNTLEIVRLMSEMAANQLIPVEMLKKAVLKLLETYQFGDTSEFIEAMDQGMMQGGMQQDQKAMMKEAVLEVISDIQKAQQGQTQPVEGNQPIVG